MTLRVVVGPIARYSLVECGVQEHFTRKVGWLVLLIGLLLHVVFREKGVALFANLRVER